MAFAGVDGKSMAHALMAGSRNVSACFSKYSILSEILDSFPLFEGALQNMVANKLLLRKSKKTALAVQDSSYQFRKHTLNLELLSDSDVEIVSRSHSAFLAIFLEQSLQLLHGGRSTQSLMGCPIHVSSL